MGRDHAYIHACLSKNSCECLDQIKTGRTTKYVARCGRFTSRQCRGTYFSETEVVCYANVMLAYVVRNHYLVVHAFAAFIHVYAVHEIHNSCRDPAFRHGESRNFVVP